MKTYDQKYFDRWYRNERDRVIDDEHLARKVRMVVGIAEWFLERPVASVLDVGCGEGAWQPVLKKLRPKARYLGMDGSTYAIDRFGKKRNLILGRFHEIEDRLRPEKFDLVVCCDVLQYVPDRELASGLKALAVRIGGVAFLEAYTRDDATTGDRQGWHNRSGGYYRSRFKKMGLTPVGLQCHVARDLAPLVMEMEKGR